VITWNWWSSIFYLWNFISIIEIFLFQTWSIPEKVSRLWNRSRFSI